MKIPRFKRTLPKQRGKVLKPTTYKKAIYNAFKTFTLKYWKKILYFNLLFWLLAIPSVWFVYVAFWIGRLTAKYSISKKSVPPVKSQQLSTEETKKHFEKAIQE